MAFNSKFLQALEARGFIADVTDRDGLDSTLNTGKPIPAYIGFDCTAPSLHVGSLMQIMVLRHLQKSGHKPIVLMGGGTTKVGDPSGKDESRKLLTDADIQKNMEGIKAVFSKFIKFGDGATDAIMVNNADWLDKLNYIEFLRDYGKFFSVNVMLSRESVKLRLEREQELTFLEFNYMVLQAYDFLELQRRCNCRLQIGGSDQWGNIVGGIELQRKYTNTRFVSHPGGDLNENRKLLDKCFGKDRARSASDEVMQIKKLVEAIESGQAEEKFGLDIIPETKELLVKSLGKCIVHLESSLFGLTTPLLATASGAKMGKTAAGAVWLNADMCSPYDYWQFWRNTEDADVGRFLKLFTELSIEEIAKLENLEGAKINSAKIILANEATKLCHGETAAKEAAETARRTFEEGAAGGALHTIEIPKARLNEGIPVFKLLNEAGLADSGGEARKLVQGKGAKLNDVIIEDAMRPVTSADVNSDGVIKLSKGKKHHALVKAV